jgi:hypothetical protein
MKISLRFVIGLFLVFVVRSSFAQQYYLEHVDQELAGALKECDRFDARLTVDGRKFIYASWCNGNAYAAHGSIVHSDGYPSCVFFQPVRLATRGCAVFTNDRKTLTLYQSADNERVLARWQICLGGFSFTDNCK